ncbi:hypothetical protein K443DRAFT_12002 [Laccaria amethystina LaAM-08-1]|uniref:Uncharacterized protein n=1 Tax=Laccaria amethystina LaAM-08-1 TaxID=1095629 RepID=A0A0C9WSE0_9AGAR|nr:hypothetical protein K443DRAFT_12002 [Laccaria amethystina LaAM-08-1]
MPPATPKSATILPPRTPTKSGLRSPSPLSKTSARDTNPNAAQPVSNEKRELPSRQRRFKPPLLAATGDQGAVSLSRGQSTRNGAAVGGMKNSPPVGGATRNVYPLVTRNAPPAPASRIDTDLGA